MKKYFIIINIFLICIILNFQNCGTHVGGALTDTELRFAPYFEADDDPISSKITTLAVGDTVVTFCIHLVQFSSGSFSLPVYPGIGEAVVSPGGTSLGLFDLPDNTYRRVQLKLRTMPCESEKTVQVTNQYGSFSTSNPYRIYYRDLSLVVAGEPLAYELEVQSFIDELSTVQDDSEMHDAMIRAGAICYTEGTCL